MKLSVCIPVYNVEVDHLVSSLHDEIKKKRIQAEIILIDDASDEIFRQKNKILLKQVRHFIFLEKNIGRARIRNLFLQYATGDFLLFLDCDVTLPAENFLQNYVDIQKEYSDYEVFYGSFRVNAVSGNTLRNLYSKQREIFYADKSNDFAVFKTVNFMIRKSLFERIHFNENLKQYGYEDYLFGQMLKENQTKFLAFQNPVIHADSSSAENFLKKTKTAVATLYSLRKDPNYAEYVKDIRLCRWAEKMENFWGRPLFLGFYKIFGKLMEKNLLSENPRLIFLDFFKLNELLKQNTKQKNLP